MKKIVHIDEKAIRSRPAQQREIEVLWVEARTSAHVSAMSALPPKADMDQRRLDVR
jgi:hypothetical protein